MLRQRIECIVLGAFLTPSVPCPETSGAARRHRCLKASTLNLRQIPFSGLLPSWSLSRWACDVDLRQVAQPLGIWLTATNSWGRSTNLGTHHGFHFKVKWVHGCQLGAAWVQGRSTKLEQQWLELRKSFAASGLRTMYGKWKPWQKPKLASKR